MNLQVTSAMENALSSMTDDAFQGVASVLSESKRAAREQLQKETFSKMKEIISKLAHGKQISAGEIALIELWIIGDAKSYEKEENNFNDWVKEYKRLANVLLGYENKTLSVDDLFQLSGLLEDALRLCFDIANFLEKKSRINNFKLAVSDGLDQGERKILVDVLTGKLNSPDF